MMKPNPPIFNIPAPVVSIIASMVVVHLYRSMLGGQAGIEFLYRFAFIPARYGNSGFSIGGTPAEIWSVLSYAFLHGNLTHLVINVLWMASFGSALAKRFSASGFLLMFALGAAGGAAMHYVSLPTDVTPMIGTSGALSAMMAATLRFAFAAGGPLAGGRNRPESYHVAAPTLLVVLSNRKVFSFIVLWFGINLLMAVENGLIFGSGISIAWQAHIGGFLVGFLLFPLLDPNPAQTENSSA